MFAGVFIVWAAVLGAVALVISPSHDDFHGFCGVALASLGVAGVVMLTTPEAGLLGPEMDGDVDEGVHLTAPILTDWVMVARWVDMETNETFTTRVCSLNLPAPMRTGLLHQALFQFDD